MRGFRSRGWASKQRVEKRKREEDEGGVPEWTKENREGGRQHRQINTHGPATPTEPYSIFYWRAHAEELVELCKRCTLVACEHAPSLTVTSLHSYLFYSFFEGTPRIATFWEKSFGAHQKKHKRRVLPCWCCFHFHTWPEWSFKCDQSVVGSATANVLQRCKYLASQTHGNTEDGYKNHAHNVTHHRFSFQSCWHLARFFQ